MGALDNIFNMDPQTAQNLTNFGFSTMAASQTPGINTLAAIGKGGLGMNEAALQRAQTGLISSEAQKNQLQNTLFPYQLQMAKINANMAQKDYEDEYGGNGNATPSGLTAGMPFSSSAGVSPHPATTYTKPSNNPGNLRPVGAVTGFQQFSTPEEGANGMTGDLVMKISGKSPAMVQKYGANYQPTLANIIPVYAPAGDNNDPLSYTKFVSDKTGIPPRKVLTVSDIPKIQDAMTQFEGNGSQQSNIPANDGRNAGQGLNTLTSSGPNADEQSQLDHLARQARLQKRIGGDPAPYQAQIQRINETIAARDKANIDLNVTGPKQEAAKGAENLSDAQKTFNVALGNLPRALERFSQLRDASKYASSGLGVNEEGEGKAVKFDQTYIGQKIFPKAATANQTISQASKQGVLSELGPQLAGLRGNKFLESIASGASGLNASDPPDTKINAINGLQDQYVANIKSLAAQRRSYGDLKAPTDAEIDTEVAKQLGLTSPEAIKEAYSTHKIGRNLAKSMLQNVHGFQ